MVQEHFSQVGTSLKVWYCALLPMSLLWVWCWQSPHMQWFSDWKPSRGKYGTLTNHDQLQKCVKHKEAMLRWKEYRIVVAQGASVGVKLESQGKKTIQDNCRYVKCLLECLLFCAQQGIVLRGHQDTDLEDFLINDVGNFRSLMILQSWHDEVVKKRRKKGSCNVSWLSYEIQMNCFLLKITVDIKKVHS